MNKLIKYFLLTFLLAGSVFFISDAAFSQTTGTTTADAAYVSGITAGRARSLVGGFIGLACLVLGWRARSRSSKGENTRGSAIPALALGIIGLVLSVVHLISTAGAVFGSGSGKAGSIVAIVLNLIGITFAALALKKGNENGK